MRAARERQTAKLVAPLWIRLAKSYEINSLCNFFSIGGLILPAAFQFEPIEWDVVIIGGLVMLDSPLLLWWGIRSLLLSPCHLFVEAVGFASGGSLDFSSTCNELLIFVALPEIAATIAATVTATTEAIPDIVRRMIS